MDSKELGKVGEEAALGYLKERGYEIIEQNYRSRFGEIDLVARTGEELVLVEVKTRRGKGFGSPMEAITHRKKQRLRRVGMAWAQRRRWKGPIRFDAIGVEMRDSKEPRIEHLRGII